MKTRARRTAWLALVLLLVSAGCTRWGTAKVVGQPREVGRRMVGAPQVATSTSAAGSGGFSVFNASNRRGTRSASVGGMSGESSSLSRTHCIQQAEITYERPYNVVATPVGRAGDVIGGVLLGTAGLTAIAVAAIRSHTIFEPGDPLYEEPPDPTAGYLIGGGLIGGGVILIGYSFAALPRGSPPPMRSGKDSWVETTFVESTGCGLVPADSAVPAAGSPGTDSSAQERLRRLDELHRSGLISDEEYEQKRAEILQEL